MKQQASAVDAARDAQIAADYDDAAYGGTLTAAQIRYRYEQEGSIGPTLFDHMVTQGRAARKAAQ